MNVVKSFTAAAAAAVVPFAMSGRESRGADASDAQRAAKRQKRVDGRKQPRTWEESRVRLEAYRDTHEGCCNVPRGWKDDPQLAEWVKTQKKQFRKFEEDPATSRLSAERVSLLKEMGAIKSWFPSEEESEDETEEETEEESEDESNDVLIESILANLE